MLIDEAVTSGARLSEACKVIGLSKRTIQRYRNPEVVPVDGRKASAAGRVPANKLSEKERDDIIAMTNQPEYASLPPSQIVPALADKGNYLASESTIYRLLRSRKLLAHRGKASPPRHSRPVPVDAEAPNQIWCWDITYLSTTVKGLFFYLYLFLDVYSRKIVGWEVYENESMEYASITFTRTYIRENIYARPLMLHSDNGSPMKGATMLGTLQRLGVQASFSRPSVSNDNAFSESLFRIMKYRPDFPDKPFDTVEEARLWVENFVFWYNEKHHHSGIKFVSPGQRHRGEDIDILAKRKAVYETAKCQRPGRWSGNTRNWQHIKKVSLNHHRLKKPVTA